MMNIEVDPEEQALRLISAALSGTDYTWTGADSSKADGFVVLNDGTEIEVEVARDLSERFMSGAAEVEKNGGLIELSPGSGSWEALVHADSSLKELGIKAQRLVDDVVAAGRLHSSEVPAVFDHIFEGIRVGIIMRLGDVPDQLAYRIYERSNEQDSLIDTSPGSIRRYSQEYIAGAGSSVSSGHRSSKFDLLANRARQNGRRAHFALIASPPMDTGAWFALNRVGVNWKNEMSSEGLPLPDGIHGFWVLTPDFQSTVAFLEDRGWFRYPS